MKIDIHDNQKKAAKEIVNHYNSVKVDNYPPVLLVAQPQSGKTGAVIYALEKIIENNKLKDPDSWTTVFWIGPSDVNLKQQTLERIESTSQTVKRNLLDATVYHMPDLLSSNNSNELLIKRYNEAKERKDYILVVMDEAHIGIGFDQTLPEFFKQRLGFFPGFEDSKEKVFTIIVTATPGSFLNYAGSKKKTSNGDSFRYVYLEPGKDYNSFKLMKQKGRIGDSYLVNDEASWYKFFHDQFIPFITTLVIMLFTDLLKGVSVGLLVSIVYILRQNHRAPFKLIQEEINGTVHVFIKLSTHITFVNKGKFHEVFHKIPERSLVFIDGGKAQFIDKDILEMIELFKHQAKRRNIIVEIEALPNLS